MCSFGPSNHKSLFVTLFNESVKEIEDLVVEGGGLENDFSIRSIQNDLIGAIFQQVQFDFLNGLYLRLKLTKTNISKQLTVNFCSNKAFKVFFFL